MNVLHLITRGRVSSSQVSENEVRSFECLRASKEEQALLKRDRRREGRGWREGKGREGREWCPVRLKPSVFEKERKAGFITMSI